MSSAVRVPRPASRVPALMASLLLSASVVLAQTRGAELVKQQKPVYPIHLANALRQGNVLLIGAIDVHGRVEDIKAVHATHPDFTQPAVDAVRTWEFQPATVNGKPIAIAANIGVRFRLESGQRGQLSSPILGDLAVFPADASGARAAPEGFPIRRGGNARIRIEAVLDLSPGPAARKLHVQASAVSPRGHRVPLLDRQVDVARGKPDVSISFSKPVGTDWEDGVWMIRFTVDGADAGGGQFWLAGDPERFDFEGALRKLTP